MTLTSRWHEVRVELLMLAEGSVTSWNKSGATGKPGHRVLADLNSNTRSAVDVFADRWHHARTDPAREQVIADAWTHVKHERGHGRPSVRAVESRDDIDRRIVRARGWSPEEIANSSEYLHTSASRVRKLRRDAGQDPETGRPDETTARIRELSKWGKSVREIASVTGVSKSDVDRRLKRAA